MATNNILYAKMICPLCEQCVETEIKINIGDTRQVYRYTIGDRIIWHRHAPVQNGGRPGNGNIDAEGFSFSSVCGDRIFVKVIIRSDIIKDVLFRSRPQFRRRHPITILCSPACTGCADPTKTTFAQPGKGHFNFDAIGLTDQRKEVIAQLTKFGVDIYAPNPSVKYDDFRIMVPHELHPATYIEIAYLMAQLVDENFLEPKVEYVESYPHGVKYRMKRSDE